MNKLMEWAYRNKLISRFLHTSVYCLQRELRGCDSVLDLGCGPSSPIQYCGVPYSVGVEAFKSYLDESKKKRIHDKYVLGDISQLEFKPKSFDAVIMIEVLEHLKKDDGEVLLEKIEEWARKKVVLSTPNGYLPAKSADGNPFQTHRSGWTVAEMEKLGYKVYGMAGWKFLRREDISENVDQESGDFLTIKFHPKIFWMIVSGLTQAVAYYFPRFAYEVFCVKEIRE